MQKLGVSTAAINAYLSTLPALGTLANPLEEIITQKYIANFLKVEPWNDYRRTGYPVLPTPVEQAVLPGIPQRIRTPGSELSRILNQVTATGIPTGLEGMSVKVWWASEHDNGSADHVSLAHDPSPVLGSFSAPQRESGGGRNDATSFPPRQLEFDGRTDRHIRRDRTLTVEQFAGFGWN
jgi:hypothetical protein